MKHVKASRIYNANVCVYTAEKQEMSLQHDAPNLHDNMVRQTISRERCQNDVVNLIGKRGGEEKENRLPKGDNEQSIDASD